MQTITKKNACCKVGSDASRVAIKAILTQRHRATEYQSIREGHLIIYRVRRDGFALKSSQNRSVS